MKPNPIDKNKTIAKIIIDCLLKLFIKKSPKPYFFKNLSSVFKKIKTLITTIIEAAPI